MLKRIFEKPKTNLTKNDINEWFTASRKGDSKTIKRLINQGININLNDTLTKNSLKSTALMYACYYLQNEVVNILLKNGADPNIRDNDGDAAFHYLIQGFTPISTRANSFNQAEMLKTQRMLNQIEKLIDNLLSKNADINIKNNSEETPLALFISETGANNINRFREEFEIILLEKGANPNLIPFSIIENFLDFTSQHTHDYRLSEMFDRLVYNGYDINKTDNDGHTLLMIFVTQKYAFRILSKFNPNLNITDNNGRTALHYAAGIPVDFQILYLLTHGANPNIPDSENKTPLYYAAITNHTVNTHLLLTHGAVVNDLLRQLYRTNQLSYEIKQVLEPYIKDNNTNKNTELNLGPWKGWSRADIENLQSAFLDKADTNNAAICPICLRFTLRSDGCMYMKHNCKTLPGFYHQRLYKEYKGQNGMISFCTICGRICKEHSHYHLGPADGPKPALWPSGHYFDNDCRTHNNGGGLPEKVARFTAIRDKALELNKQIGQISKVDALQQIVEAGWNAPLNPQLIEQANKQLAKKKYNLSNTNFPVIKEENININSLPNVVNPNRNNNNLKPLLHRFGTNIIEQNNINQNSYESNAEPDKLIQFRHRKLDGSINNHTDEWVSRNTLTDFLENQLKQFNTDEGAGYCIFYPACNARLYPEEIHGLVPDNVYKQYKKKFNFKFRQAGGNKRKTLKKNVNNAPFYTEISNGACLLPSMNKRNNKGRKNNKTMKNNSRKN